MYFKSNEGLGRGRDYSHSRYFESINEKGLLFWAFSILEMLKCGYRFFLKFEFDEFYNFYIRLRESAYGSHAFH
jgi:hypothetical protein